jgi:hypothetical protein
MEFLEKPKAKKDDMCYYVTEKSLVDEECDAGLECRTRDNEITKENIFITGPFYCLPPTEVPIKVGIAEICMDKRDNLFGNQRVCPDGSVCRYPDAYYLRNGSAPNVQYCLYPILNSSQVLGAGQTCYQSTSTFGSEKMCQNGLVCRLPDEIYELSPPMLGAAYQCLKPFVKKEALKENDTCYQSVADFGDEKPCPEGFVCRLSDAILNNTAEKAPLGAPFKCLRPYTGERVNAEKIQKTVLAGDACYQATLSFGGERKCPEGYVCRHSDDALMARRPKLGAVLRCLKPFQELKSEMAAYNEACYKSTPNYKSKSCPPGLVCRATDDAIKKRFVGTTFVCLEAYKGDN